MGNHGTHEKYGISPKNTQKTAAYAAYGKDGKTKEVGIFRRMSR